ncbi:MAG: FAD-dependent oxidoreductase, partial [Acidobacteriales bacterium]|nr:FAD-dependent oxidoreductase [Terriglobales bacterium]
MTPSPAAQSQHICVIGAGAFGGWSALHLRRAGAKVTLVDLWGPGNARSSSGDETRILRGAYGPDGIYTHMAARALALWKEHEARWRIQLFHPTGVLWMTGADNTFERASLPHMREAGIAYEEMSIAEAARRYPQINMEGIHSAIFESSAGYLLARRSCEAVFSAFLAEGGRYVQSEARPAEALRTEVRAGRLASILLADGSRLEADAFVFACGPWLGKLFPDAVGDRIRATRQEVFYFGTPRGSNVFDEGTFPVWGDHGQRFHYGLPNNKWRGFKIADDTRGPAFDPDSEDRLPKAESLDAVRRYMEFRFPAMRGAPLVESRVCQYENTGDNHLLL